MLSCDGFKPLHFKKATAEYMVKNDLAFAGQVLGHNEFGERVCGWKP